MNFEQPETPASWDIESLEAQWLSHLKKIKPVGPEAMPFKRVQYQAENEPTFRQVLDSWPKMSGDERAEAWNRLIESSAKSIGEMLPVCVRCGECCKKGSPTLDIDDLDILRTEKIGWDQLLTLRQGEPAHSPYTEEAFYLPDERIKVREKPGTTECIFYDGAEESCTIFLDKPTQCRAQACWDQADIQEQAKSVQLTRRHVFADVPVLLELLDEHDSRCSFERLRNAFDELVESEGKTIDTVVDILAFEDHFRNFVSENLKIPEGALELVFGRSLADRVRLFGFRVETDADGTRTLVPIES